MKKILIITLNILLLSLINTQKLDEDKPVIQEISIPKNLKQSKSVRLNCGILQGELPITFNWFFNNIQITGDQFQKSNEKSNYIITTSDTSSDLLIKSLAIDNLGDYRCCGHQIDAGLIHKMLHFYFKVKIENNYLMKILIA